MDSMVHLAGQFAGLFCTRCQVRCVPGAECTCCAGPPAVIPVSEFAEGGVVSAGDSGEHGDSVPAILSQGYVMPRERLDEILGAAKVDEPNKPAEIIHDEPPVPEVEVSAEPQADVQFIESGDTGVAGESN